MRGCEHFVFASSSSIYGGSQKSLFSEADDVSNPVSPYAATKKSCELMGNTYNHLYALPVAGLRFFTVYGPWGRPDLALYKFVDAILDWRPIDIYNHGDMYRDFTYVEDLVRAIHLLIDAVPKRPEDGVVPEGDSLSPAAPYRVVNIGNSDKVRLLDFVDEIENCLEQKAERNYMGMQTGDVPATWANADLLKTLTGYRPQTDFRDGIAKFVDWYREYSGK